MRTTGDPCPICGNPIKPLDSWRSVEFHGRREKLHHRCWFENQEMIAALEATDAALTLEQAFRRAREGNL